jgi:hypothetical protein
MTVPPSPSFLLAKPFVGAGEGSDDGGFAGLERAPVGPLGTPTGEAGKGRTVHLGAQKESVMVPRRRSR